MALESDVCLRWECVHVVKMCISVPCVQGCWVRAPSAPPLAVVIHCCRPAAAPCPRPRCPEGCGSDSAPRCCASYRPRASRRAPCAPGWTTPPAETAALSTHQTGREDLGWWHSEERETFLLKHSSHMGISFVRATVFYLISGVGHVGFASFLRAVRVG